MSRRVIAIRVTRRHKKTFLNPASAFRPWFLPRKRDEIARPKVHESFLSSHNLLRKLGRLSDRLTANASPPVLSAQKSVLGFASRRPAPRLLFLQLPAAAPRRPRIMC